MFVLRDILLPLQDCFSNTDLVRERASLFVYTILPIIVPFMASSTLPWAGLWKTIWELIPSPEIDGRILVALDDFIITKIGKKIFGCEKIFDHAAKSNQSKYPWAQNIVSVGLLKQVKGRCVYIFKFSVLSSPKNN